LESRAENHAAFVEERSREKGPLGHRNRHHGFPVMTSQEEELRLEYINSARAGQDGSLIISYRS
ncbi:MAG TPA: hypothetical protein VMM82_05170, partial [Spirochaetia bacterium]|nr:hypothetical protein [Spirochaetia bacterium]